MKKATALLALLAAIAALAALAVAALVDGAIAAFAAGLLAIVGLVLAVPAYGGRLAMARQHLIDQGRPDLLQLANADRSEEALLRGNLTPRAGALRGWLARRIYGHQFLVGDPVRVRSYHEIRATLDPDGRLDGLPFMEEMKAFCGRQARVYRVVDKIYDYGRSRELRRIERSVLLVGLRCDGSKHNGCDAACYMIWKEAWLEPHAHHDVLTVSPTIDGPRQRPPIVAGATFSCQYTELSHAARPMTDTHSHHRLEPWITGNLGTGAFFLAMATRAFNAFQERRRGIGYPWRPSSSALASPTASASIQGGDWVRVRTPGEIAATLDAKGKNKGLWFDREMLKHCGQTFRVLGRVERIIDIKSTTMIPMKTPCIVLSGVHSSGEFLDFAEQHDYMYFREAWLEPVETPDIGR